MNWPMMTKLYVCIFSLLTGTKPPKISAYYFGLSNARGYLTIFLSGKLHSLSRSPAQFDVSYNLAPLGYRLAYLLTGLLPFYYSYFVIGKPVKSIDYLVNEVIGGFNSSLEWGKGIHGR